MREALRFGDKDLEKMGCTRLGLSLLLLPEILFPCESHDSISADNASVSGRWGDPLEYFVISLLRLARNVSAHHVAK